MPRAVEMHLTDDDGAITTADDSATTSFPSNDDCAYSKTAYAGS